MKGPQNRTILASHQTLSYITWCVRIPTLLFKKHNPQNIFLVTVFNIYVARKDSS